MTYYTYFTHIYIFENNGYAFANIIVIIVCIIYYSMWMWVPTCSTTKTLPSKQVCRPYSFHPANATVLVFESWSKTLGCRDSQSRVFRKAQATWINSTVSHCSPSCRLLWTGLKVSIYLIYLFTKVKYWGQLLCFDCQLDAWSWPHITLRL